MKCVEVDLRSAYCNYFDLITNKCKQCSYDDYYVSSHDVCCKVDQYHKTKDSTQCVDTDDTVANCSKVIINEDGQFLCTDCK